MNNSELFGKDKIQRINEIIEIVSNVNLQFERSLNDLTTEIKIQYKINKLDSEINNYKNKEEPYIIKLINNIINIDNKRNIFIKLSYRFNIFNISLLCNKYFDIVNIILNNDCIDKHVIEQIFKDFN